MSVKLRYILSIVAALVVAVPAYSQFTLTGNGFVNARDRTSDYYIIDCPGGVDVDELFCSVAYFLESRLGGPGTMFNAVEPISLTVNAFVPGAVVDGRRLFRTVYDLEFRMMVDICNGAVRIWAPEVKSMTRLATTTAECSIEAGEASTGISVSVEHPHEESRIARLFLSERYVPGAANQYQPGSPAVFNRRGKLKRRFAKESAEDYVNGLINSLDRYINATVSLGEAACGMQTY